MDTAKKLTIMVVEDDHLLLEAIKKKLLSKNFDVIDFRDALSALNFLKQGETLPDVIWLDYYLGEISGLDFMKEINGNSHWTKIPVIVVSNSASPQKVDSMMNLGAKMYLLKAENKLDDIVENIYELTVKKG